MFPLLYDLALALLEGSGLRMWRKRLIGQASGHILEIGAGRGLNVPLYRRGVQLVLTDPHLPMLSRARGRFCQSKLPLLLVVADAQRLPFDKEVFDTVVATLAFCTIPQPAQAFAEVHRVLKPAGRLILLEHVRSCRPWLAWLQDVATPMWKRLAHGCHLNRDTLAIAKGQGFIPLDIHEGLDGWLLGATLQQCD